MKPRDRRRVDVIGTPIDVVNWEQSVACIDEWAEARQSRVICICNVHSVVTARTDLAFAAVIQRADMATPDGAPVAWMLRRLGAPAQQRINGPDLMLRYCEHAARTGMPIFLYGGAPGTLEVLLRSLPVKYPGLRIAGAYSPPFRELTTEEDATITAQINESGAGVVWVSLGCPKQEKWMDSHRGRVNAVMVGVGAAFDYHAGTVMRAPVWMQRNGMEWLFRLVMEPRRLWRRYFSTNTRFILLAARQLASRLQT